LTTRHPLSAKVGTTWPTSGGRSVGIVRSRTKATVVVVVDVVFKHLKIQFKYPGRKQYSITQINQLVLFREITAVYSENHTKHKYTVGKMQSFLNVRMVALPLCGKYVGCMTLRPQVKRKSCNAFSTLWNMK
jgi:hypothetical protein